MDGARFFDQYGHVKDPAVKNVKEQIGTLAQALFTDLTQRKRDPVELWAVARHLEQAIETAFVYELGRYEENLRRAENARKAARIRPEKAARRRAGKAKE